MKKIIPLFLIITLTAVCLLFIGCPSKTDESGGGTSNNNGTTSSVATSSASTTVSTPVILPQTGSYTTAQSVSISCATSGVIIRYTTDGSDPTAGSMQYDGSPIPVNTTTTIKAQAFLNGNNSVISKTTYILAEKNIMVSIAGGTYTQTDGTYSFSHTITGFSMGQYEVTYELWYTVKCWAVKNGYTFYTATTGQEGSTGALGAAPTANKNMPVTMVSWYDCIVWCNAYSEISDKTPCYTYGGITIKDATKQTVSGIYDCDNAECNLSAAGYRLPTEGEWQYAAGNKGVTPYNYASGAAADYTNAAETKKVAWYSANASSVQNVGTTANQSALTLCDMSGNVYEWCFDIQGGYPSGVQTDYTGPLTGYNRIIRGGSCSYTANFCQVGYRYSFTPDSCYIIGFRIARR